MTNVTTSHAAAAYALASEAARLPLSHEELEQAVSAVSGARTEAEVLRQYALDQGFEVDVRSAVDTAFSPSQFPMVVLGDQESWALLAQDGDAVTLVQCSAQGQVRQRLDNAEWDEFHRQLPAGPAVHLLRNVNGDRQKQAAEHLGAEKQDWLKAIFIQHRSTMLELCAASTFGNLLAIATSLFAMQVWDRVVPAQSTNTLWVLVAGVTIALIFDFFLRSTRALLTDHLGKQADLELSSRFYAHMLAVRNDARPRAPGTLISQLRDLENVRDMMTSTTLGALLDLPFLVIFLIIIWILGGPLVLVPLIAIPLVVVPGLFYQRKLGKLSRQGMAESALRNSILMETVYRVEDIKNLQAETRFRHSWNHVNDVSARVGLEQRHLMHNLTNWSQSIQQLAYIGVITLGVFLLFDQKTSFGAVLACSILTSRTIAPISQVAMLLGRLQSALVGKEGLDQLLELPTDHDAADGSFRKADIKGQFLVTNAAYRYHPDMPPALTIDQLVIQPGERIGVLGKTGAGKSTLLRLLSGNSVPQAGQVLIDDVNISAYSPADLRRFVGPLLQDSALFFGTLKENLKIGAPEASDEQILDILRTIGADQLLLNQPAGLALGIRENGIGLSGGQRQAVMLARTLIRNPRVLILDEPTSSFDDATEQDFLTRFGGWLGDRTLIVSTHRFAVTKLVDRLIVVDKGRIVMDGPKGQVIAALSGGGAAQKQGSVSNDVKGGAA